MSSYRPHEYLKLYQHWGRWITGPKFVQHGGVFLFLGKERFDLKQKNKRVKNAHVLAHSLALCRGAFLFFFQNKTSLASYIPGCCCLSLLFFHGPFRNCFELTESNKLLLSLVFNVIVDIFLVFQLWGTFLFTWRKKIDFFYVGETKRFCFSFSFWMLIFQASTSLKKYVWIVW